MGKSTGETGVLLHQSVLKVTAVHAGPLMLLQLLSHGTLLLMAHFTISLSNISLIATAPTVVAMVAGQLMLTNSWDLMDTSSVTTTHMLVMDKAASLPVSPRLPILAPNPTSTGTPAPTPTSRLPSDLDLSQSLSALPTNSSATPAVSTVAAAAVVSTTPWLPLVMVTTVQAAVSMPSSETPGAKAGEKVVTPGSGFHPAIVQVVCACSTNTQATPYHHEHDLTIVSNKYKKS